MSNLKKIALIQIVFIVIAIILNSYIVFSTLNTSTGATQKISFSWSKIIGFKSTLLVVHAIMVILSMITGITMIIFSIIHDDKRWEVSTMGIIAGVFSLLFILQIVSLILSIIIVAQKHKGINMLPIDQREDFARNNQQTTSSLPNSPIDGDENNSQNGNQDGEQ